MSEQEAVANEEPSKKPGIVVANACAAKFFKGNIGNASFYDSTKGKNWNLESKICLDFVNLIGNKFSRSGRIFGYVDQNSLSAAENFQSYLSKGDFTEFINGVMERLCHEANDPARRSLSEGYVVFAHYRDHDVRDYLLVVMLGKKGGYDFEDDENLTPKDTESLNLQDFRQAACMDLTSFSSVFPENKGESYLYFIKGNSKSEFFNTALGCSDSVAGKVCVDNLKKALDKYFEENEQTLSISERRDIHKKVKSYMENNAGKRVSLTEIQIEINKCLPTQSPLIDGFHKYLHENSEIFKVSEEFQPSHAAAKSMAFVDVKLSSGDFEGRVKLDAITVLGKITDSDADLSVDKDFVYLRIKLPSEASKQIRKLATEAK